MNEAIQFENKETTAVAADERPLVTPVAVKPFLVSKAEILFALLSYAAAYIYTKLVFNDIGRYDEIGGPIWRVLPILAFAVAAVIVLNRGKKITAESWFWLACLLAVTAAFMFRIYTVWNEAQLFFFVHGLIVWWVLSHSGKLLDGESGHFLPMDGINGFIVIPFYHYFLRVRTLAKGLQNAMKGSGKSKKQNAWWIVGALFLSLFLFVCAAKLLMRADSQFAEKFEHLLDWVRLDAEILIYLFLSLPVGAYIYGLIGGAARMENDLMLRQKSSLNRFLESIRRVPAGVWAVVILLFSVLYIAFFALQASYFLGGFNHTLPEGFIVSQYAREGFFELCRVMTLNFVLLWLVTRMSEADAAGHETSSKLLKVSCLLLLAESLLFAVIAASKILLYISNFGFTSKRIQSLWLVGVLAAACLAWGIHLMSGKKTMKLWMMLSAGTLCALAYLPV
ncbi:MAG: DUF4173 domain-containing protein [Lachnospiraceae bacterium]|nr:DUF4173 domain-containing protein [Lachnospiraceae bacterium]